MGLDLRKVNITSQEDLMKLEEEWNVYYDNKLDFTSYKHLLSKMNIIIGFGRGFWSGIHGYFYLIYLTENDNFYWYLRDIESDQSVFFYKIDEEAPIFEMLRTLSIEENYQIFDEELNFSSLYNLSVGNTIDIPEYMHPVELIDLFGEDTEQLRLALMIFYPGDFGSSYPHRVFHNNFYAPSYKMKLDEIIDSYNKGNIHLYRKGNGLYIDHNADTYQLKKLDK